MGGGNVLCVSFVLVRLLGRGLVCTCMGDCLEIAGYVCVIRAARLFSLVVVSSCLDESRM